MGEHRSRSSGTESERTTVSMRVTVGAASAAIPRQRASYWQAPIAAEAAPTRALTRLHKGSHKIISCERCARPTPNLRVWKSRRGSPSGPVAQARRHTGKSPKGLAMDGQPFPLRQDVESETSGGAPTRAEGH